MTQRDFLTGDRLRDQRNVDLLLDAVVELYASSGDLDTLVRRAVDRAVRVTGAERGMLLLSERDEVPEVRTARDAKGLDLPGSTSYSRSVVRDVWTRRAPVLMTGTDSGAPFNPSQSTLALKLRSILAVPLLHRDRAIGVLYVDSRFVTKEFSAGDRAVFEALAGLVSVAIESARLAADEAERKRLAAEMDAARRIQERLFPAAPPALPGFDVAFVARSCVETSGDYLDVVPLAGGRCAFVIGDVSGHGLPAALVMTSARAATRALLSVTDDLAHVLGRLNAYLCHDLPDDGFMSLFVGVLDPARRAFAYASAGHNPPLLRRVGGEAIELGRTGKVLGIDQDAAYGTAPSLVLGPGDALLLYTDGLFEARGEGAAGEWGEERLLASFASRVAAGASARGVLDGVLLDLSAHVGARPLDDDVSALVLRGTSEADGGGAGDGGPRGA